MQGDRREQGKVTTHDDETQTQEWVSVTAGRRDARPYTCAICRTAWLPRVLYDDGLCRAPTHGHPLHVQDGELSDREGSFPPEKISLLADEERVSAMGY